VGAAPTNDRFAGGRVRWFATRPKKTDSERGRPVLPRQRPLLAGGSFSKRVRPTAIRVIPQ